VEQATTEISSSNARFLKTLVENGRFDSEFDALDEAVTLLREREENGGPGEKSSGKVPASDLGRKLRAIRERYINGGGTLFTIDEIDREVIQRRGERYPQEQ